MLYKTLIQRIRLFVRENKEYVDSAINSSAAYLLAYNIVYYINQLVTVLIASGYNLKTILYYYGIRWISSDFSAIWTKDSVITTFISGSVILFFLSVLFIFLIMEMLYRRVNLKIFFIWLFVCSISRVIGGFIIWNLLFLYGSNLVADWMRIKMAGKMVISIIGIILTILSGYKLSGAFLLSSNDNNMILLKNRLKFLFFQTVIPWFAGGLIMLLINLPKVKGSEIFLYSYPLIFIIPAILNSPKVNIFQFEIETEKSKPSLIFIIITLSFLIGCRIVLFRGIHFGT